jgi:hypothetical protein
MDLRHWFSIKCLRGRELLPSLKNRLGEFRRILLPERLLFFTDKNVVLVAVCAAIGICGCQIGGYWCGSVCGRLGNGSSIFVFSVALI